MAGVLNTPLAFDGSVAAPLDDDLVAAMQRCGETLFHGGLNNSHSGNLSIRRDGVVYVTRAGCMLHAITADDIVATTLEPTDADLARASSEFIEHLAIYQSIPCGAVVHVHPLYAIALAMEEDEIIPLQLDGHGVLRGKIPVLEVARATRSPELCEQLPPLLAEYAGAIVRGHGAFLIGDTLEHATHRAFVLETAAHIITQIRALGYDELALRRKPYLDPRNRPARAG